MVSEKVNINLTRVLFLNPDNLKKMYCESFVNLDNNIITDNNPDKPMIHSIVLGKLKKTILIITKKSK